jgi:hypothetical protein
VTPEEREILRVLKGAKGGYRHDYAKDLAQIRALSADFPRVDMLEEAKKMAAWLIDKPDTRVKNSRSFMRNWIAKAAGMALSRASPPETRQASTGIPDPHEIQRRFEGKYSKIRTGGVVIDV